MVSKNGALATLIDAGARILENACGPCIGMGFSPPSEGVSLRTFNRNFKGRSGTKDADVFLVSPAVAAASAISGEITDPRTLGPEPQIRAPRVYPINDNMIIPPAKKRKDVEILRGPNIKPLPKGQPLAKKMTGEVLLKVEDNITTDHIMPAGAKILPLRSNVPAISEYVFETVDPTFPQRAKQAGSGFIVGGNNYGQGSSREHAALAPMYLGVRAVITKSFARIHQANLVNFGIVPLVFENEEDYDLIEQGDKLTLDLSKLDKGATLVKGKKKISLKHTLGERDLAVIRAGGSLLYARKTA
jgi:aconitate hydratase